MREPSAAASEEKLPLSLRQILGGRYFWLLLLYSVSLLAITGTIAAKRHLWWDEIEVSFVATLPNLKVMWHALGSGVDWQPPTYYFPLHYLCKWFGASPFVLRSIAVFPYWLATLVVYVTVARRTTPLHGFVAMVFPSLTFAFSYAFEARPYALVLLFTACTFLCWQLTREQRWRRLALPGLALSLGAAFGIHYNACLIALPLLAGEAIRAARRRVFDIPVLTAICCGAWPVVFLLPRILVLRDFAGASSTPVSTLGKMLIAYQSLFSYPVLISFGVLALLAVWFAIPRKGEADDRLLASRFDSLSLAASGVFLIIPIAYCGIAHFSKTYYPRYVIETVIGAAIFLALLLHGAHRAAPRLSGVLLTIVAVAAVCIAVHRLRAPDEDDWGTFAHYRDLFDANTKALYNSKDPVVLGQGPYLLTLRYGNEELRGRAFHLLSDSGRYADPMAWYDRIFYRALEPGLPVPSHLINYKRFMREHQRFLLYNPDGWVLARLLSDGQDVKIQALLERDILYSVVVK
jgi:hypothetical protein